MNPSSLDIDIMSLPTPCYLVDENLLLKNLEILKSVSDRTGCKILLAQKAFSMYHTYPLIKKFLAGTTSSSIFEARLGKELMGGETHIYAPAFIPREFKQVINLCDHIVFNSPSQLALFRPRLLSNHKHIECGLRVNPEYAEVETELYNPCAKGSRLGTVASKLTKADMEGFSGLHFHAMCEQNSDTLKRLLDVFEEKFGEYLYGMKWLNFGGGHHITREDYDIETLIECITHFQQKYGVEVYLEPGEAVALNAGYLISEVLDIVSNGIETAILDTSAACHMPDVIEMPYRPNIIGAGKAGEKKYTYRLSSNTCLAGDIISDYSFDQPLKAGDRLVFQDMAIYTMVKNNTFNGINLPSIALHKLSGITQILKQFSYEDFKARL